MGKMELSKIAVSPCYESLYSDCIMIIKTKNSCKNLPIVAAPRARRLPR